MLALLRFQIACRPPPPSYVFKSQVIRRRLGEPAQAELFDAHNAPSTQAGLHPSGSRPRLQGPARPENRPASVPRRPRFHSCC